MPWATSNTIGLLAFLSSRITSTTTIAKYPWYAMLIGVTQRRLICRHQADAAEAKELEHRNDGCTNVLSPSPIRLSTANWREREARRSGAPQSRY